VTDPDDPARNPVAAVWEDLLADAAATAEEYREKGYDALELHPGDVAALPGEHGDRVGLDVLIPDDEYEAVATLFEEGFEVDGYEVYSSTAAGVAFFLVVVYDEDHRQAVLFPGFYTLDDDAVSELFDRAREEGRIRTYLRRLSGDFVAFRHDDPELFAPPDDAEIPPREEVPDPGELVEDVEKRDGDSGAGDGI
jgi:hypothetical protein